MAAVLGRPLSRLRSATWHDDALARPLSDTITALLRDGDDQERYTSRSEAVMATALAAASAGWSESAWREVLADSALGEWASQRRRKGGGRRPRNAGDAERRLVTTWVKAVRRVAQRPPTSDHLSVRAELAAVVATADHNPAAWSRAAGVTDRAVLAVLVDVALAAGTLTPSASVRQVAEAANVGAATATRSLQRLREKGWLRLEHAAQGTQAAAWRLVRPEAVPEPSRAVEEVLETVPPRPLAPVTGSARAHDAFAHTTHGGLGRVAARLFDALDDGSQGGLSIRQLAALTGLHPRTVARHLITLQAAGLATAGAGGSTWARSAGAACPADLPAALEEAAAVLGSTGVTAARAARHAAQREAFTSWRTDFDARRGWAVQRGLYRPDAPRLPLQRAA